MRRDLAWTQQGRIDIMSVLKKAPWRPLGPEMAAVKRSWKETLGWDDGLSLPTLIRGHPDQLG